MSHCNTFKLRGVRKIYRGAFIGGGRNSGKQLVFKKSKHNPKRIEAVHGASKTRFPILFKRAVEFQMLKARGRI